MTYWIVVSNASKARIYSADKIKLSRFLILVKSLFHPQSRYKKQELISDRPGHYQTNGPARGVYAEHTDLKEVEKNKFAEEVAEELELGRRKNNYMHLIIITPSHFYGLLEKHLTKKTMQLIEHVVHKDYTSLTDQGLEATIRFHCKPNLFSF